MPMWRLGPVVSKSDIAVAGALFVIIAVLAVAKSAHYLLFHTMAELFAIVVSFLIFILTWTSNRYLANGYLIVLGGAYGAIGFVDLFHTLTFRGMNLFPGISANYPTQFWLSARYLEALALLLGPLVIVKRPNFYYVSTGFAAIAAVACAAVVNQWLPATFIDGVGLTPFKIYSEYVIIAMLIVGFILLYRCKRHFEPRIFFLLASSLWLAVATEFCFTRYAGFYDFTNEIGHYFRFLCVTLAFIAVVLSGVRRPLELVFREMDAHKRELDELNKKLTDSEDRLKRAQRVAKVGSWYVDIPGKVHTWSDESYRIFGEPVGTAISFEIFASHIHPDDRESVIATWNRALQGQVYDIEHRIFAGDQIRWVREIAEFTFAEDGSPLVGLGTIQDITERKRAEQELRGSEMRFRAIIEASPVPLAMNDEQQNISLLNLSFIRTFGYTLEDIPTLAQWWPKAYPDPAYRQWVATNWQLHLEDAQRENKPFEPLEVNICCKGGAVRTVLAGAEAIGASLEGFHLVTLYDVTEIRRGEAERAQLEAQLRESQKMEALGTLAGGVAHDFNNALASIIGNVELARQDVGPGHAALVSLEEIGKASRRAKDLVQQILAFGRRQKLERKATSLALVVVESARLIRATLPAGVSLNVDCRGDTPAVLADATAVKQLLLNLCTNALQAIQDHGRPGVIEVCLDAYTQGEARGVLRPGLYARLTVRDNGPGMDEATRSRIFEPFFTTKPMGKGTGLGLSVVHGIAQAHEASIEVESAPGVGSTFRIYFPAVEAPIQDIVASTPEPTPVHGKGKHVLYVDDEEAIIFLMKRLLERQGYRVSGYTDPREALAAVRAKPDQFDLAVTDYNMPGMSGLELARVLREIRPDMPVVLASGYIDEDLRAKAPAAGVSELIYKPDTVDELCDAVARFANAQSGKASRP